MPALLCNMRHAFRRFAPWLFDPGFADYGASLTPALRDAVYLPYLAELRDIERRLRRELPQHAGGWGTARGPGLKALVTRTVRRQLLVAP